MCPKMKASVCRARPREGQVAVALLGAESYRGKAPASEKQEPMEALPLSFFLLIPLFGPHGPCCLKEIMPT